MTDFLKHKDKHLSHWGTIPLIKDYTVWIAISQYTNHKAIPLRMQQLPLGQLQVTITSSFTASFSEWSTNCHNKRENLTDIFFFRKLTSSSSRKFHFISECNAWNSALSSDLSVQWWLYWLQESYLQFTFKLLKERYNPETSSTVSVCLSVNSLMLYWPNHWNKHVLLTHV